MKSIFYMISGAPGSGKTTYANNIKEKHKNLKNIELDHYEADMFFYNDLGEYNFDFNKLHYAHQWCFNKFSDSIRNKRNVVVSNTFINKKERINYLNFAFQNNYDIVFIHCLGEYNNIHNVPEEIVLKKRNSFQQLDDEEKSMVVEIIENPQ